MEIAITVAAIEFFCIIALVIFLVRSRRNSSSNSTSEDAMAEVEKLKLYANLDFDKIEERIDKYINDIGDIYKMNNFEYKEPEDVYLNEDAMNDMIRYIVKEVRKRITPAILELMRLSYNINSEDDLITILYERVRMYVLRYSFEVNAPVE